MLETVNLMYRKADIRNYTVVTLQHAFFIFLGLLLLHDLAIFALKMTTSIPFRKASLQTKLLHLLESTRLSPLTSFLSLPTYPLFQNLGR